MKVRLIALAIFAVIVGCALLSAYEHKPFELRIQ